jgi:Ca-activated chloride channel homolog
MSFVWPVMLYALLMIPVFILLYIRQQVQRRKLAARYGSLGIIQEQGQDAAGLRRHLPSAVFLIGLTALFLSLARPQTVISLPRVEGTVILAFDVSGSMAAKDLQPTRIDAAKTAAQEFVQRQPPSVQIGVVAFSDAGFSVQVPTNDRDAVAAAIDRLTPQRGTSLANGILASLQAISVGSQGQPSEAYSNLTPVPTPTPTSVPAGTYTSAAIVLLTDGENNENPDPLAAAKTAAQRGVRIYTVGIGSAAGTLLHVNGFTVHTQLDETLLKQIAQISGGEYYTATSAHDLQEIYASLDPQLVIKPEKMEITSVFAGAGLLVLLIGGILSLLWFGRLP